MKKIFIILVALILALALAIYFRPLAVFAWVEHFYLVAHGFRGHDTTVGRWRIHYIEAGEGPPLIAIHGIGANAESGAPVLPALARSHRVLAPDLLGYGHSEKPKDSDYSIATESDVVRGFMDRMRIDRADVLGVSMGGWVALKLAADHPERVRRLVLVDSAGLAFRSEFDENTFSPNDVAGVRKLIAIQTDRVRLMPDFVARDFVREIRKHGWIFRSAMRSMLSGRDLMDGRLESVTMPTLLIWGNVDRIIPLGVGKRMAHEIPNAKLVVIPKCGHLAIFECREQVLPPIEAFLKP